MSCPLSLRNPTLSWQTSPLLSSRLLQPCPLCSRGAPARIYDERHPEVSFTDRAGVSTLCFVCECNEHVSVRKWRHICTKKMEDTERCGVMFVVFIHSFSHNSLGLEGADFLCSVLPSLPNLTSLR